MSQVLKGEWLQRSREAWGEQTFVDDREALISQKSTDNQSFRFRFNKLRLFLSQIIPPITLNFRKRSGRVDWRLVSAIDPDTISRKGDISALQV